MNRVRPTQSAMVALLMLAVASSYGSAAVVVLSNRTADKADFVLADEKQEQPYTLAADEVQTLRISPATDFWFIDDPESAYRLRGGCAYIILRNGRDRRLELHRLGLAEEQSWPDKNQAVPEPSAAAATPGDELTTLNERGALVRIVIAFDAFEPADVEAWERRLRAIVDKASQVTSVQWWRGAGGGRFPDLAIRPHGLPL